MRGSRELQKDLDQQLVRLASLPALQGPKIDRLIDKLRQNRFNLVVLRAFKRGKSTLINALLGKPVLPTAIVPLTSVVTILSYGEQLGIEVLFTNGERCEISPEELVDYTTEKGNPRNQKGVQEVKISYPSPYLRDTNHKTRVAGLPLNSRRIYSMAFCPAPTTPHRAKMVYALDSVKKESDRSRDLSDF